MPAIDNPKNANTRILLVNDEPELLLTLKAVLVKMGYPVMTAEGYEEARGAMRSSRFDLLISDFRLNGQNGHGLLLAAEAKKGTPSPAVVLVAGDPEDVANLAETVRSCVDEYIYKPVQVERLLASITRALEKGSRQ